MEEREKHLSSRQAGKKCCRIHQVIKRHIGQLEINNGIILIFLMTHLVIKIHHPCAFLVKLRFLVFVTFFNILMNSYYGHYFLHWSGHLCCSVSRRALLMLIPPVNASMGTSLLHCVEVQGSPYKYIFLKKKRLNSPFWIKETSSHPFSYLL